MRDLLRLAAERQKLNDTVRSFFRSCGYTQVETPLLVRCPDLSPNLLPLQTRLLDERGRSQEMTLITSPEFSMKKLLGQGMEKIFTITKVFRNGEEVGGTHQSEFTMLEWYCQGADYRAGMDETQALVQEAYAAFGKPLPNLPRQSVRDLLLTHAGVDLDTTDLATLRQDVTDSDSDAFYRLFVAKVEPHLKNVFVYDYPRCQAALSRLTPDGRYGERFELYLEGLEICNAFTELTDPAEQRARFEEELAQRRAEGKPVFPIDEELLRLLPSIRQPTFGNALGLDRLHMAATGRARLQDVLLLPLTM